MPLTVLSLAACSKHKAVLRLILLVSSSFLVQLPSRSRSTGTLELDGQRLFACNAVTLQVKLRIMTTMWSHKVQTLASLHCLLTQPHQAQNRMLTSQLLLTLLQRPKLT